MLARAASQFCAAAAQAYVPQAAAVVGLQQVRTNVTYIPLLGDGKKHTVTLIPGDGIGPEVTKAVTDVLDALKAPVEFERFDDFKGKLPSGKPLLEIPPEVLASIKKNRVCLKGTLETPVLMKNTYTTQSLNVQLRKQLDLAVNIVHGFNSFGCNPRFADQAIDIIVIRENTEGEYSGVEHELVPGVTEARKVMTFAAASRTAQYAFEFAMLNNRKKVSAIHKANIIKMGDGMFLKAFRQIAPKFPMIKYEEMIVDNTCMQLTAWPQQFDVMVCPNLYGNLVQNVVAGLCGSPGLSPGANIGRDYALFEQGARHVAKDLVGKNSVNPTAWLLSTSWMLRHQRLFGMADRLEAAVRKVYSDGDKSILTKDVGGTGTLTAFTQAVIKNIE